MSTVEVRELDIPAPAVFVGMTFPAYRHLLTLDKATRHLERDEQRVIRPVALGAWQGAAAVGLVLGEFPVVPDGTGPQLLSAFVVPELRDNGIGTALVSALEAEIRSRGFDWIETVYTTGKPGIEAMERVLVKCGWLPPVTRALTVRFFPAVVAAEPWFDEVRLSAPDCEIFPWSALGIEERDAIRRTNQDARWIPPGREPWAHDLDGFDTLSSMGLRQGGAVLGWVINHRVADDTMRFSCAFVREDLAAAGRLYPLVAESIRQLAEAGVKIATFVTPLNESEIAQLLKERCPAAFEFFGETRGSVKWLNVDTAGLGA